jgi:hypothetical protein
MATLIDQTNDSGHSYLVALLKTHPKAYELVKTAEVVSDFSTLPDDAFAWPSERKFPIHTRHDAVLSHLYMKVAKEKIASEVREKVAEALEAYGVDTTVLEPEMVKEAAIDDKEYIFPDAKLYRVKTAQDLFKAQERMLDQVGKMSAESRAEGFTRLYKRAQELGQPLDPRSYQYAGVVETDLRETKLALEVRAAATKDESVGDAFMKLASTLGEYPRKLRDRSVQVKLAQLISDLDTKGDLKRHYDRRLPDPIQTVFNTDIRTKVADQMVELGQDVFPLTQLCALSPNDYGDILGPEIVSEISLAPGGNVDPGKLMQILPTLPQDLKAMLGQRLRSLVGG